jgi:hypothetical protein
MLYCYMLWPGGQKSLDDSLLNKGKSEFVLDRTTRAVSYWAIVEATKSWFLCV